MGGLFYYLFYHFIVENEIDYNNSFNFKKIIFYD